MVEGTRAQILKKNIPGLTHCSALYYVLSEWHGGKSIKTKKRIISGHLLICLKIGCKDERYCVLNP